MIRVPALAALVGLAVIAGLAALPATRHVALPRGSDAPAAVDLWSAAEVSPAIHRVAAPVVELRDLLGSCIDLRQLRGRIVLVYFWGSW